MTDKPRLQIVRPSKPSKKLWKEITHNEREMYRTHLIWEGPKPRSDYNGWRKVYDRGR